MVNSGFQNELPIQIGKVFSVGFLSGFSQCPPCLRGEIGFDLNRREFHHGDTEDTEKAHGEFKTKPSCMIFRIRQAFLATALSFGCGSAALGSPRLRLGGLCVED
jgi:hypothetical protein